MPEIKWTAKIFVGSADNKVNITSVPVLSFQVNGGRLRTVHLNAAQESDLAFELDDARDFKNIQVFIAPTQGIAATQLGEAFVDKKELEVFFVAESRKGATLLKAFALKSDKAVVLRHPITTQKQEQRTVKIEMSLPNPFLQEVSYNSKEVVFKPV